MKKTRNWTAISSWFRNSAGPIKDEKKEANKNACRDFDLEEELEYIPFGPGMANGVLVGLEYFLTGFEQSYNESLVEEIALNPTPEQIEKVVGKQNTYNCYALTPTQIKDIFNLDVDPQYSWFFETSGIYKPKDEER